MSNLIMALALRNVRLSAQADAKAAQSADWLATKKRIEGDLSNVDMRARSMMPGRQESRVKVDVGFGECVCKASPRATFGDHRDVAGHAPRGE